MSLISIIITHEIQPAILSSILTSAYKAAAEISTKPSLKLLTQQDHDTLWQYASLPPDVISVTYPPLPSTSIQSPFLTCDPNEVCSLLNGLLPDTWINPLVFLIADEVTARDGDTLLLGQNLGDDFQTVRLSAAYVNTESVAVAVGSKDVREIRRLVDEDGVFRGGLRRSRPPMRGRETPRKMLGER
ncbi:uncharacterized protein BDV17DRAFT_137496 [Aspergillus undulatus]|uniref:uncharacterized protein n=1 Tax=Aspergillus undulatus TaxID=1810928 RepID=UPI003CCDE4DE